MTRRISDKSKQILHMGEGKGKDYVPYILTSEFNSLENPTLGNPTLENPTQEKPTLENPMQLNKDIQKTDLPKKEKSNTDLSSNHSIPILSPNPSPLREETAEPERKGTEAADAYSVYEEIIKDNIEYEHFIKHTNIDRERLDEIVSLILETVCTKRKTIRIAGDDYPAELVKAKFMKLNSSHIEFVSFKGKDIDVMTEAFREFTAKKLGRDKKPSIRKLLSTLKDKAAALNAQKDKVKKKDREVSL